MPFMAIMHAGKPNAHGDVYTHEALVDMAEKNSRLKYQDGCLLIDLTEADMQVIERGGAVDLRTYECGDECEHCGAREGEHVMNYVEKDLRAVKLELCAAATMYHWDGTGENPNRPLTFCQQCKQDYYDRWEDQWAEYRSSQGF